MALDQPLDHLVRRYNQTRLAHFWAKDLIPQLPATPVAIKLRLDLAAVVRSTDADLRAIKEKHAVLQAAHRRPA